MFTFNFNQESSETEKVIEDEDKVEAIKESTEIKVSSEKYAEIAESLQSQTFDMFTSSDVEIGIVENININENGESDLISGVYEGGFKIWECTQDLADHFTSEKASSELEGKFVCDLGCSAGVLGILSLVKGAKAVHFQDYNEDVLEKFTIPNVVLYCEDNEVPDAVSKCCFYSGDWGSFKQLTESEEKYDIIITSETIYNPLNYAKLLRFFKSRLAQQHGKVYLAAKSHYFGVGGNTLDFCKFLEKDGNFKHDAIWKSSEGLQREILLIQWK